MIPVPRREALRYLGCRGDGDQAAQALLDACIPAVEGAADPRWTAREVPLLLFPGGVRLGEWDVESRALRDHLEGCGSALLFAATLGVEVDRLIARGSAGHIACAAGCQASAAALIEAVCDDACEQLSGRYPGLFLRPRFSPGYADFPLPCQKQLLSLLDAPRKIGLTATDACLLAPSKSVTAVVGLSSAPGKCHAGGCATCSKTNCAFRR